MLLQEYISVVKPELPSPLPKSYYFVAGDTVSTAFGLKAPTFPQFGPKNKRLKERNQSICKWLRDRISGSDIGVEIEQDGGKHPIHINTNNRVLDHFDRLRHKQPSFLSRLSNMNLVDHLTGVATFYFAGASEPKKPETLVLIDIDCKETGSLEGALAFAEYLRSNHFANLYYEPSTHGRGAHGYFVLEKWDTGSTFINNLLLRRLQPWLRQILKQQDFDVENVEIKGTLPNIVWGKERLEVTNYTSGMLAKLPRLGTPEQEEALRNTTRLTVDDLAKLPVVKAVNDCLFRKSSTGRTEVVGSVSGKAINEEELNELDGHYGDVAAALLESHKFRTTGKTVVVNEDMAIFLLLLKFITKNMNHDGSLPVKRFKELWQALFTAGDVNRAFCPQRFAAIRNHLSSLELLDWQDKSYQLGWYDSDGQYHKGKSSKWKASDRLMAMLEVPAEQERYEKGEEETSFIRTDLTTELKNIIQLAPEQTIRPLRIDLDSQFRLTPEQLAPLITPFETFAGMAA